ncbi:MAG: glycosyltransferase family 39 protein [Elusimicrobia bacterium]|nr:glycosyltransferase family 39 protein [Elusimicrobiota bacterium]
MTDRPRAGFAPAVLALSLAFTVALLHTLLAWRYFAPRLDDLLSACAVWGPNLVPEWLRHSGRVLGAAAFFVSLPGLGARLLRRWKYHSPEDVFVQTGLALVVWSTGGLLLAALRLSSPSILRAVSLVLILLGLSGWRKATLPSLERIRGFGKSPLGWALLGFAGLYLLTTVVPETFYDALVYHLAVPSAYLLEGGLKDLADIHLTRLPGLLQTLYLWGLAWSDDRLCKLMNWGFGLLSAGLIGSWTAKRWGAQAGRWAALLFLSSPMIGVNLWSCTNDLLCGFFFFLSFILWLESWEPSGDHRWRSLALSGFFFGAAAASKYTALFACPFFLLDLLVKRWRARRPFGTPGLIFAAGVLLPLFPWWLRTGLWTGNPFFPQAASLFGGDAPGNIALLAGWRADTMGDGNLFHRSLSLVRESLRGVEEGRFGFIGPVILMLLPLSLFLTPRMEVQALLGGAFVSYVFFVFVSGRIRYFIPQLGLLFALSAASFWDYSKSVLEQARFKPRGLLRLLPPVSLGRWMKRLLGFVVALNALWLILIYQRFYQGWDVACGRQSPGDYLRQEHVGVYRHPSQGAFDFLSSQTSGRLFVVGEARTYRSPFPARAAGAFNVPVYAEWIQDDPSPEVFLRRLQKEGYSHLLLNATELRRITPGEYKADAYLKTLGHVLDAIAPPVYRDKWTILFRVPDPLEGPAR